MPIWCTFTDTNYTYYVRSQGRVLAEYSEGTPATAKKKYIYAGNNRIAMRDASDKLHYYLKDHLGSARVVIDSVGNVMDKYYYYSFGESQGEEVSTNQSYRYTSKPLDMEGGIDIYYYGARYYDPELARFMSIDPAASKYPGWSPYVYTLDNPLKYIDPDGELTYLVLHGAGELSPSLRGSSGDQGNQFRDAAITKAKEIRYSQYFNPKEDNVYVVGTSTKAGFFGATNNSWESGPIQQIHVFSHAWEGGLNLGGSGRRSERLVLPSDVTKSLNPTMTKNSTLDLYGCNTAKTSGSKSITQAFANKLLNTTVSGYKGPSVFRMGLKGALYLLPQYKDRGRSTVQPNTNASREEDRLQ